MRINTHTVVNSPYVVRLWFHFHFRFLFFFVSSCALKIYLSVLVSCSYMMYVHLFRQRQKKQRHKPFIKILCFIKHYWYTSYDIIVMPLCRHVYYMRYLTIVSYQFYKCLNLSHDITEILFDVALNTTQSIYLLSG